MSLKQYFSGNILKLIPHGFTKRKKTTKSNRKPINAEIETTGNNNRALGPKGYSQLEDYLLPVISQMQRGLTHTKAFHNVENQLDVGYSTVIDRCTRALGLTTNEFVSYVQSGKIIDLLESKFPEKIEMIRQNIVERA